MESNGKQREEVGGGHVAPWRGVGVGYLNDPVDEDIHRGVVLLLTTAHGQLGGVLIPEVAEQLSQQLHEHAMGCTPIALEIPRGPFDPR